MNYNKKTIYDVDVKGKKVLTTAPPSSPARTSASPSPPLRAM